MVRQEEGQYQTGEILAAKFRFSGVCGAGSMGVGSALFLKTYG